MIPPWTNLDDRDRRAFWAAVTYLKSRLSESDTIGWALRLGPEHHIERIAISHLLNNDVHGPVLDEPWATTWRLINESWTQDLVYKSSSVHLFDIKRRLHHGDRSSSIVSAIVNHVAPRLRVRSVDSLRWQSVKKPRRPKTLAHLVSVRLTSGTLLDLNNLALTEIGEISFLTTLADALEAAVNQGLYAARRIGWDGDTDLWRFMGSLHRVRYARYPRAAAGQREPDAHHRGIAPAVKLLHAVVTRIAEVEPKSVRLFAQRWRLADSPVHIRLWSEPSLNRSFVPVREVEDFFLEVDDHRFWNARELPEVAELRALRFNEFGREAQRTVARRIRKKPPRNYWPRAMGADRIRDARLYWALREFRRIEVGGGALPRGVESWMRTGIERFPDLADMKVDEGLPVAPRLYTVQPNPDERFDMLHGVPRLRSLEAALSPNRSGWDDVPAVRAGDWLRLPKNTISVICDLESTNDGGDEFPHVWDRLGWTHTPTLQETEGEPERDVRDEAKRVLHLLDKLSDKTLSASIESISYWLRVWSQHLISSMVGLGVWLRVWPIAVSATNDQPEPMEDPVSKVLVPTQDDDRENENLDTLNTPSGRLVSAFLSACPSLEDVPNPFHDGGALCHMRDAVIDCTGRSALISRYRLLEALRYFLHADRDWTQRNLIDPLLSYDDESITLWPAAARGPLFTDTLQSIGNAMAERATDGRLGRETRTRLVFSLVIESLHAFRESRGPAVSNPKIQQMLRSIDDEIRADAADTIQQFVLEISESKAEDDQRTAGASVFRSAAAPFLAQVWPLERSLATPGVSRALADLPATSGEAFSEAVETIERLLIPFQCWSMLEYGLYGDDGGIEKLSIVNDETKAKALLRLLDLTVGTSEDATVPHDLTDALDQIRRVAPGLVSRPAFRRLSTAARR